MVRHSLIVVVLIAALAATITLAPGAKQAADGATLTETKPCTKKITTKAIKSFIRAYNRGNSEKLDSLFAAEPEFQWYSSPAPGRRLGNAASRRATLVRYFKVRHRAGDRLHLRRFHFTGNSRYYSNYWFDLGRRANGYNRGRWFRTGGKGALICEGVQPKIIVISLGGRMTS